VKACDNGTVIQIGDAAFCGGGLKEGVDDGADV